MDSRQKHAGMTDSRHPVNGYDSSKYLKLVDGIKNILLFRRFQSEKSLYKFSIIIFL